jgi:hypothetical protein
MARRRTVALGVAVLAAIGITALPATGQDGQLAGTLTSTGKAKKRDQQMVDVRRKP